MKIHRLYTHTRFLNLTLAIILMQPVIAVAEQNTIHRDDWYLSQAEDKATIQMSGHASEKGAIAYIQDSELKGEFGYYQTSYKDKPWYAVTYGLFDTLDEARGQAKLLPAKIQRHSPWPRTFKAIKSQISTTAAPSAIKQPKKTSKTVTWEEGQEAYDDGDFEKAFSTWLTLAKQGDELSQFNLGVMFNRGEGAEQNISKAIEWYTRSAEQGYAPAQFNLGAAYLDDNYEFTDKRKTANWWRMAAEQGFVPAQFNLAGLYCQGIGVPRDTEKCRFWYKRAASNGDMLARKMLKNIQDEKITRSAAASGAATNGSREKNSTAAVIRKPTSQERTLLRKAQAAFIRNNYMKSHKIWLPLAESGLSEAQYSLGFLYQSGWGPERDLQKAVSWYTSAAEQNEARAQFNLGVLLLTGEDGLEKDTEKGLFWLTRSAENKNTRAKEFLVDLYTQGKYGVEKSKDKADFWSANKKLE